MSNRITTFVIKGARISAYFSNDMLSAPDLTYDCHHHAACVEYVNISGYVSFRVEDRIYNIKSGDVIITQSC